MKLTYREFIVLLFTYIITMHFVMYQNKKQYEYDVWTIIGHSNKLAREVYLLKKRFGLLSEEDLIPKG